MGAEHHAETVKDPAQFWDEHYGTADRIWSGRVNPVLAEVATTLEVGRALDLGCGEGADAVWLAGMGWRVTAVDISINAIARARVAVKAAEVESRVTFEQHDLSLSFPVGEFDLVSAQYLQSPIDFPRAEVLQRAAQAVALGGRLLIVDHGAPPSWAGEQHRHAHFPSVDETVQSLELAEDRWRLDRVEAKERPAVGPNGQEATLLDNIILACRLA